MVVDGRNAGKATLQLQVVTQSEEGLDLVARWSIGSCPQMNPDEWSDESAQSTRVIDFVLDRLPPGRCELR